MIRIATEKDISRIAEILIFSRRTAYRNIFNNDKVSFGEMQVLPLAMEYINNPNSLKNIFVFDDEFVKGIVNISVSEDVEILQIKIIIFNISHLLEHYFS